MKNDTSLVLTISMLTSGKKDMRKSLECLQHFKKAFPCEIILVDTGCNEEQRRLIEKYGDKIVDFTWCDDFAAARNAGLKEARGEWFLYLDDDEYFEYPREIISFFQTGEYKEYRSAAYTVRSYLDTQGGRYTDSYLPRMARLEPESRFEGKIHECLQPFEEPRKVLGDIAHHYGYVYENETQRDAHAHRNIEPLLEMRKRYPEEPRWIACLAQEYLFLEDYEKTAEVCRMGLEECEKAGEMGVKYANTFHGAVYACLLIALECMEEFEEEEVWLDRAMSQPMSRMDVMAPTTAYYCFLGARLYCMTGRYEKSRDYLRRYIDYLYQLGGDREAVETGAVLMTESVFQPHTVNGTLMCMEALIRLEDYSFAEEAFYLLDWEDKKLLHQDIWEKNILDACCSMAYHPLWVRMLQTLCSRKEGMKEMLVVFLEREVAYEGGGEEEKLFRLCRLAAELDYGHRYFLTKKLMWAGRDPMIETARERREKVAGLLEQMFAEYPEEVFNIWQEAWDVAEEFGVSCEPYLLGMEYNRFRRAVEIWCRQASLDDIRQWEKRIGMWKTRDNIRYSLFAVKCTERYLKDYKEACPTLSRMEPMLWRYADAVIGLYAPLYREYVFAEIPEALPEEVQLAIKLKKVEFSREQQDNREILEAVRGCLGVCIAMEAVVEAYAVMCRDDVKEQTRNREEDQSELRFLIAALKGKARQEIEGGEYQAAREILLQVAQCAPEDEEVKALLERIPATF